METASGVIIPKLRVSFASVFFYNFFVVFMCGESVLYVCPISSGGSSLETVA